MKLEPMNDYIHCKEREVPKEWLTFGVTSYECVVNIDTEESYIIPQSYSKILLPDGTFLIKSNIVCAKVLEI